ncbi:MAG: imidazoleglycerol-phosphate dehydratase HisB [Chitinivibrionales bacterium]|nr:imidazoleglycerol-phosphate dehydratase HisB [Chitinivibrionales bacterium]MBD3358378.1 imidazoleglycerol-phosphate dehydratase HisB [Chitinivibrionales bacterium]
MKRKAQVSRRTNETDISLNLVVEGTGNSKVESGNGFMDHMLTLFAKHGRFELELTCKGDTNVDFHHSAEDIGICLGQAVAKAVGAGKGIIRYGWAYVPMDESLGRVCIDLCGRPNLVYAVELRDRTVGTFDCDLAEDFFKAFADNARLTMHVDLLRGRNSHHSLEALFKAAGRALDGALRIDPAAADMIPSTKGII